MFKFLFNLFTRKNSISSHIIKTELSIVEYSALIDEVTSKCFVETEYHSEYLKPMFALSVLRLFTDIEPTMMKNEDDTESTYVDIESTYQYCKDNDIVDKVSSKCEYGYISNLFDTVIESLEYKKDQMIAQTSNVSEQIVSSVKSLIDTVKNVVANFDMSKGKDLIEMAVKMNKAGLNDSGTIINEIVKQAAKNAPKTVDKSIEDNVTPIPTSPTSSFANVLGD